MAKADPDEFEPEKRLGEKLGSVEFESKADKEGHRIYGNKIVYHVAKPKKYT